MSLQIEHTLMQFCRAAGMENPKFNSAGGLRFRIESIGELAIEPVEGAAAVYLARKLPPPAARAYSHMLKLSHYSENFSMPIQPSKLLEDVAIFGLRIPDDQFLLHTLYEAIEVLRKAHDRLVEKL
jgi:type III secretion system chaperone SycN